MQFVALRAVEAALYVIQDDVSVGATTVMTRPIEQFEPRFARESFVQSAAAQTLNEPNRTIKLHNADMQFVELRAVVAALHVIQDDESVSAITMLRGPNVQYRPAKSRYGHLQPQTRLSH